MYEFMTLFDISLFFLISPACSTLVLIPPQGNVSLEFDDADASFGAVITDASPLGKIMLSDPILACSNVTRPIYTDIFFALIERGNCTFAEKVAAVQNANFSGAIVINVESDYVFPMGSDEMLNITIPAVMIGRTSGDTLRKSYLFTTGYKARMKPNSSTAVEYYLVPMLITLSLAFFAIIIFLAIRVFRNCLRQSKNRLSRDILNKLPEIRFSEDYQNIYETCAICLEDYTMGDKLRVLPCHHAYHSKCVDRWLLRRQGSCPVCKYRIHRSHDDPETDNEETRADDEEEDEREEGIQDGVDSFRNPNTSGSIIVSSVAMRSAGATQSTFINECNEEDIGDRAPLLNTASSVPTWLSSGQLPYRESTWLGYDNPVAEIDDESVPQQVPQTKNFSEVRKEQGSDVSFRVPQHAPQIPPTNLESEEDRLKSHDHHQFPDV